MNILFCCGKRPYSWDSEIIRTHAMGGSEKACESMARELAQRGHSVIVNNEHEPWFLDDEKVEWTSSSSLLDRHPQWEVDVLIVWGIVPYLSHYQARLKVLWCHDALAQGYDADIASQADIVFALSHWHKRNLVLAGQFKEEEIYVTRNGIDGYKFRSMCPDLRDHAQAIYASHPRRGLATLLRLWPQILKEVPQAKLSIFHDLKAWEQEILDKQDDSARWVYEFIRREIQAQSKTVAYWGPHSSNELAHQMMRSGALLYPCTFPETSCMTALEAQAAGMRLVTSSEGALRETVGSHGVVVEGDPFSESFAKEFVRAAVTHLSHAPEPGAREKVMVEMKEHHDWSVIAKEWEELFTTLLKAA